MLAPRCKVVVGRLLKIARRRLVSDLRNISHVCGRRSGSFGRPLFGDRIQYRHLIGNRGFAVPSFAGRCAYIHCTYGAESLDAALCGRGLDRRSAACAGLPSAPMRVASTYFIEVR